LTKTTANEKSQEQQLDSMDIERERGITIKLKAVRMNYKALNGETYLLNLIDTPGHVDFGYEVSRSLAACEGALLVVDATQGVEAQTIANVYLALDNNLEIVPIINKIDLPSADPENVKIEIENTIGLDCSLVICCSAKTGYNVNSILESIVHNLPAPKGNPDLPFKALIYDSFYDNHRGVIVLFRIFDGEIIVGDKFKFMYSNPESNHEYFVNEVGIMTGVGKYYAVNHLRAGEVGYLSANVRQLNEARVGDTITHTKSISQVTSLPGYLPAKPMVFAGLYPSDSDDYEKLRDAIHKLQLNDASLTFTPEASDAMGFGFRCGFLGLLHMDVMKERLEREYDLDIIVTAPSVVYRINMRDGSQVEIDTPSKLPDASQFDDILEPYVQLDILAPGDYMGAIMGLSQDRRGMLKEMKYITTQRVNLIYEVNEFCLSFCFLFFFILFRLSCLRFVFPVASFCFFV
jgi:GTP-binding protein LepA